MTFFLLDGKILRAGKLVGLDPEAVKLFHQTIRKQLEIEYSRDDYDRYLSGLFEFDADELFLMGKIFNHKKHTLRNFVVGDKISKKTDSLRCARLNDFKK